MEHYLHGTKNSVFRFVFTLSFPKTLLLLTFNNGNKVFDFWIAIPSQKSEKYARLECTVKSSK